MRQIGPLIHRLQMDITTTMAVDDTLLRENKEELDNEDLIRYYFYKGFQYKEITSMSLQGKQGQQMSLRTLKKRLNIFSLNKRNAPYDIESVRKVIENLVNDGHGSLNGYLAV